MAKRTFVWCDATGRGRNIFALYRYGRVALAEHVMRRTWGRMKNAGAWTIWETTIPKQLCQGWGCAPLIAMARRVLGVRTAPGRPERVLIAPTAATPAWAHARRGTNNRGGIKG